MKLKLTEDGSGLAATNHEGNLVPVVVYDDGSEKPLNPVKLIGDVKKTAERASELEKNLGILKSQHDTLISLFGGEEPETYIARARTAIETLDGLNSGDLADAEALKKARAEAVEATEKKYKNAEVQFKSTIEKLTNQLNEANQRRIGNLVSSAFASSPLVKRLTAPAPMVERTYATHFFEDTDGEIRAKDSRGEVIMSRTDPVNKAGFEEALAILIDASPWKSDLLSGPGGSGPNTPPHSSSTSSAKSMHRAEFDKLNPAQKAAIAAKVSAGEMQIVNAA